MLTDPGSLPVRLCIIGLMIGIHGFFTAVNTAMSSAGRIIEKYQAAIRLLQILTCAGGAWLSAGDAWLVFVYLVLFTVLGQYFPHKIGLQHDQGITEKMAGFIEALSAVLRPLTAVLMFAANLVLKIFKQKTHVEDEAFSEEDVMSMLKAGKESGALKEEGTKMINSIFAFDDKLAYEIMTPRTDVFLIDIEDSPEEYLDELMKLRYSRIPVCRGDNDNIIGILHIKDYLIKARESSYEDVDIEAILRKAYFVPDTKNIDSLFFELQMSKQQIAVLIDEYGGFSGIVTMEDIIEEIVGEIADETDNDRDLIVLVEPNQWRVDGRFPVEDAVELGWPVEESDDYETLAGWIIHELDSVPRVGDELLVDGYAFKVVKMRRSRISIVQVKKLPSASCEESVTTA